VLLTHPRPPPPQEGVVLGAHGTAGQYHTMSYAHVLCDPMGTTVEADRSTHGGGEVGVERGLAALHRPRVGLPVACNSTDKGTNSLEEE